MRRRLALAVTACLALLASAAPASAEEPPPSRAPAIAAELAIASGATMALAPAAYSAARLVGTSSANLNTSALPALVIAAVLPPAIASGAVALQRDRVGEGTRVLRAALFAAAAQLLVLGGAFLAKTWVADTRDLLLLSAATGAACGGAATLGAEVTF